jgi:hypothetical protein
VVGWRVVSATVSTVVEVGGCLAVGDATEVLTRGDAGPVDVEN